MKFNEIVSILIQNIENDNIENEEMVQLIELIGSYLNLKTISKYAKESNMSYNGVKKHRTIQKLFGVKFVIDND